MHILPDLFLIKKNKKVCHGRWLYEKPNALCRILYILASTNSRHDRITCVDFDARWSDMFLRFGAKTKFALARLDAFNGTTISKSFGAFVKISLTNLCEMWDVERSSRFFFQMWIFSHHYFCLGATAVSPVSLELGLTNIQRSMKEKMASHRMIYSFLLNTYIWCWCWWYLICGRGSNATTHTHTYK